MKKINKKAFTIIELVVVIAIIAVLAGVLIPTFANLVKRANISSDTQLVRNLNTALALDNKEHKTMQSALDAAEEGGFDVARISSKISENKILWDSKNDVFCYLNNGEIEYVPNSVADGDKLSKDDYKLWIISDVVDTTYSTYLYGYTGGSTIEATKGLDVGKTEGITAINYSNIGNEQKVVIRTNGGTLTVDAPQDTVFHYGNLAVADIQQVNDLCYYEYGIVGTLSVKSGTAIIDNGGVVAKVDVVGDTDSSNKIAKLVKQNGGVVYEVPDAPTLADGESAVENQICSPATEEEKGKYGYIIASNDDLSKLREWIVDGSYNPNINIVIVTDIEVSEWIPLGNDEGKPFTGTIIGNNHNISGLTRSFIKYAEGNINISNLNLDVNINDSTEYFIGGLIGVYNLKDKTGINANVLIDSVVVSGNIDVKDKAGGIVGSSYNENSGSNNTIDFVLSNCVNKATVKADRAGGMIGTSAGYFAKDNDENRTGTTFKITFENCTNDAVITSSKDSGVNRAGGFIGYCGGSGNYVFNSTVNKKTEALIGYSRIGGTPKSINDTFDGIKYQVYKEENMKLFAFDDYDYYQGATTTAVTCKLWRWHGSLSQTQGAVEFTYYISNDKLNEEEWRFTFDGKHYKFPSNSPIKGIEDGVEQINHSPEISSNPNDYVTDGITVEYKEDYEMNNSGTINNFTGWMVIIGEGTYSFDPTNYISHDTRNNFNIKQNDNGTWTVEAKSVEAQ